MGNNYENNLNGEYYSRNSLFRGLNHWRFGKKVHFRQEFSLFGTYGTYSKGFGKVNLDFSAGYSFQEEKFEEFFVELGNFPNDLLGYNALETSRG